MLKFSNPKIGFQEHLLEYQKALFGVLDSDSLILGESVEKFESEFAEYVGTRHCVGVNSGTDALIFALKSIGIVSGDEVIMPSLTAVATAAAVVSIGAVPIYVDVDLDYCLLNVDLVEEKISEKTKAVIAVHLYGQMCDMGKLMSLAKKYNIKVIEDCAQAHGSKRDGLNAGSIADVSAFSFYPTKNLGGIGDGGAVVTNSDEIYVYLKQLRQYGWTQERVSVVQSGVSRLDEIQAAVLRVKLKYLNYDNERRRKVASIYNANLVSYEFALPKIAPGSIPVFHLYAIQVENRDFVASELEKRGVLPGIHYKYGAHQNPAYKSMNSENINLKITESICRSTLSLPMYPQLSESEIVFVVNALKDAINLK